MTEVTFITEKNVTFSSFACKIVREILEESREKNITNRRNKLNESNTMYLPKQDVQQNFMDEYLQEIYLSFWMKSLAVCAERLHVLKFGPHQNSEVD